MDWPRRLALLCLPLALAACQRSAPPEASVNNAARQAPGANRLMPRGGDRRERAVTAGDGRVTCDNQVDSIPCTP